MWPCRVCAYVLKYHQRLLHWLHFAFLTGIVWLYSEHSHHWQPSDHIALQRYHQTRHSQETAWRRPTFPKKSVSTRGFDSGVPGALPRQNTTPVPRDHQAAPATILEEVQWIHCMVTFFKHTVSPPNKQMLNSKRDKYVVRTRGSFDILLQFYLIYYHFLWTCGMLIWGIFKQFVFIPRLMTFQQGFNFYFILFIISP